MSITLGGIPLPEDLLWDDELGWCPVSETVNVSLGGSVIIQASAQVAGRPVTLSGGSEYAYIDRAAWLQVQAMAADPAWSGVLDYHGREITVRFRHGDGAIAATPVVDYSGAPEDTDELNNVVIRLRGIDADS